MLLSENKKQTTGTNYLEIVIRLLSCVRYFPTYEVFSNK